MQMEYDRIFGSSVRDPGTAGDEGEENWANLLREWLPPKYAVQTKGVLINPRGEKSPQADVVVLKPGYPKALQKHKTWLADGVAAIFECKNTLKTKDIQDSIVRSRDFKRLVSAHATSTPFRDLHSPLVYGVLAHSHSWKSERSDPLGNVEKALQDPEKVIVDPKHLIDFLCVSDLGFWHNSRTAEAENGDFQVYSMLFRSTNDERAPIGSLISALFTRLSYDDYEARQLAQYFISMNMSSASADTARLWHESVVSAGTQNCLIDNSLERSGPTNEWLPYFGIPLRSWSENR